MIYAIKTTSDGKLVAEVDAISKFGAYLAGDKIEYEGKEYEVSGRGREFRLSSRDRRLYLYLVGSPAPKQYRNSEAAWAAGDEEAWNRLRQQELEG